MTGKSSSAAALALSLFIGGGAAVAGSAQDKLSIDLPAQPLVDSLKALSSQTNSNVFFEPKLVAGLQAPAIKGQANVDEILDRMLKGTGLTFQHVDSTTVSILPVTSGAASYNASGKVSRAGVDTSGVVQLAQSDTSDLSSPNEQGTKLEEVIVTAQKRRERLLDAPQSVTALSGDDLSKIGAKQFTDFANTVPGLSFNTSGAGATNIILRGVTAGADVNTTVATYVDDVPYGTSGAFAQNTNQSLDVGLFDIDRIEVLRGPQGTLYGASSIGGLIKYVTKQPDMTKFGGQVQAGVSSTHDGGTNYDVASAINLPISQDRAALRVSGFESHDDGYIDNLGLGQKDVNESDVYGGRLDLLLMPTDKLTIHLNGFMQNIRRDGAATADYSLAGVPTHGSLIQDRKFAEPFDQRFRLASGTIEYDFGQATLSSISSYQTVHTHYVFDVSPIYAPLFSNPPFSLPISAVGYPVDTGTNKVTQELRLASDGLNTIDWLLGAFYTHESTTNVENLAPLGLTGQPAPYELFTFSNPSHYEEYAAFGDVTWHISQRFDVTGGLRYSHDEQDKIQLGSGLFGSSQPESDSKESVVTYLANARYHFSGQETGYVRLASGYRPGGPNFVSFNPVTHVPNGPPSFDTDHLYSYEVGFKAETDDRRFAFDLAGYYIDWKNIQISVSTGSGFTGIANASGGASVKGAELTLTARPVPALVLTGAFSFQDATLSHADENLGGVQGERLPNVPRFSGSINADYTLTTSGTQPTMGLTLRHVGERNTSFDASKGFPQYELPDYTTADMRAAMTFGAVNMQLYVHNLFDERGQLGVLTPQFGNRVAIMQPRTVGLSATVEF